MEYPEVIAHLQQRLGKINEADRSGAEGTYLLELTGNAPMRIVLTVRPDAIELVEAEDSTVADATCRMPLADFVDLLEKRVSAMAVFMSGRMWVDGDLAKAVRLQTLIT